MQSEYRQLPFGELLDLLQKNGFIIDAHDHAEFTAVFDNMEPDSQEHLKYYLAPIVCRNEDEQKKFYKVFDLFLQENKTLPSSGWWEKFISFIKKIPAWVWILLLASAGLIAYILLRKSDKTVLKINADFCVSSSSATARQTLNFSRLCNDENKIDTTQSVAYWNFGDGTPVVTGNRVEHAFARNGYYTVSMVAKNSANPVDTLRKDTVISVCPALPTISTVQSINSLKPGDIITLLAKDIDPDIDSLDCYWVINNVDSNIQDTIDHSSMVNYRLSNAGNYTVSFYYSSACTGGSLNFRVEQPKPYELKVTPGNTPFTTIPKVNPLYKLVLLSLGILSLIATWILYRRKAKPPTARKTADTTEFTGIEGPFEIPYLPKDRHIQSLLDISKISYNLSRRTEAESPYLYIPGTITNSIRNYGLVTPAYKNRQKPREYLILVDDSITHNQQVHLFTYLIKKFIRENVLIDLYFYYKTPNKFYKENIRTPVNFQKLRDCSYQSSLVIIGKGYDILDTATGDIAPTYRSEFEWWEKRVLVTPVPAKDWSVSEKTLSGFFHLVPADITGWISLAQIITEDATITHFTEDAWRTYNVKFVDTGDIGALKKYLGDDDLFQWLCSTAIHHNIRWEILIELGHALLSRRNVLYKLNYTNLLKLSRIHWMEEGVFPATTRLSLLKELTVENELLARKTMLQLLKESDELINASSFTHEEKEVQKYTDSFLLYANNPAANDAYKDDADKFLSLWEADKIVDTPLGTYLKKEEGKWSTPIRSVSSGGNISIGQYIKERDSVLAATVVNKQRSYKKWARICAGLALFFFTLLAAIHSFRGALANSAINRSFSFVQTSNPQRADIKIMVPDGDCILNFAKDADSVGFWLDPQLGKGPTNGVTTTYFKGATPGVDTVPYYEVSFHDVDISKIANNDVRIILRENKDNKELSAIVNLSTSDYVLSLAGTNCVDAFDTISIFYMPGYKDNYQAVESQIRDAFRDMYVSMDLTGVKEKASINYVTFGDKIDSLERYTIASGLLKLGIGLKQIRYGNFEAGLDKSKTGRVAEINGDPRLDKFPMLTEDSIRRLLLNKPIDPNRPLVYIQFDPFAYRDSIELFRRSLVSSAWQAPGIEKRSLTETSVVRYFTAAQKPYADTIALLASDYFKQTIRTQLVQRNRAVPNQVELWLKSACRDIKYSSIWRSIDVPFVYGRSPNTQIRFTADRIYQSDGGSASEYLINQNMKKCGQAYTMYAIEAGAQQQVNPNTVFNESDKGVFSFDGRGMRILDEKTGNIDEQTTVIFDFNNYTVLTAIASKDVGAWDYQDGSGKGLMVERDYYVFQLSAGAHTSAYTFVDGMWDSRSGCRIYKVKHPTENGKGRIVIIYDGVDGPYVGIVDVDWDITKTRSNAVAKAEFLRAWGKSVAFHKIERFKDDIFNQPPANSSRKILWVEQSSSRTRPIIDSLRYAGYSVNTASDSVDARNMLSKESYSLVVISDYTEKGNFPDISIGIWRALRSRTVTPRMILYSSESDVAYYESVFGKEGTVEVYVDPATLSRRIRELVPRQYQPSTVD